MNQAAKRSAQTNRGLVGLSTPEMAVASFFARARRLANLEIKAPSASATLDLGNVQGPGISPFIDGSFQETITVFETAGNIAHHGTQSLAFKSLLKLSQAFECSKQIYLSDFKRDQASIRRRASSMQLLPLPQRSVYAHGQVFLPSETTSLVSHLSHELIRSLLEHAHNPTDVSEPLDFHAYVTSLGQRVSSGPLLLGLDTGTTHLVSIDNAMVFSGHRLRKKSWQLEACAHANVRYFHAALRSSTNTNHAYDVVYALTLNSAHVANGGAFITDMPHKIITSGHVKDCLPAFTKQYAESGITPKQFIEARILEIYGESLAG